MDSIGNTMKSVDEMVRHFQKMRSSALNTSMYEEVKWQYINMAKGGHGGPMGFADDSTCRSHNYKGYPDSFFQKVCEAMGWLPRKETITLETYSSDPF